MNIFDSYHFHMLSYITLKIWARHVQPKIHALAAEFNVSQSFDPWPNGLTSEHSSLHLTTRFISNIINLNYSFTHEFKPLSPEKGAPLVAAMCIKTIWSETLTSFNSYLNAGLLSTWWDAIGLEWAHHLTLKQTNALLINKIESASTEMRTWLAKWEFSAFDQV